MKLAGARSRDGKNKKDLSGRKKPTSASKKFSKIED